MGEFNKGFSRKKICICFADAGSHYLQFLFVCLFVLFDCLCPVLLSSGIIQVINLSISSALPRPQYLWAWQILQRSHASIIGVCFLFQWWTTLFYTITWKNVILHLENIVWFLYTKDSLYVFFFARVRDFQVIETFSNFLFLFFSFRGATRLRLYYKKG